MINSPSFARWIENGFTITFLAAIAFVLTCFLDWVGTMIIRYNVNLYEERKAEQEYNRLLWEFQQAREGHTFPFADKEMENENENLPG